jgi:hypothetical protein
MCALVHVALVMATHSGSVAADIAVSLSNYTQYQLLSLQNSTKQVISFALSFRSVSRLQRGLRDNYLKLHKAQATLIHKAIRFPLSSLTWPKTSHTHPSSFSF